MARKSSCLSGCFYYLGILTLLGVVAAYFVARHYMLHPPSESGRSPEYLAAREAFFNNPITLPKEWQDVKPFPADLLELRKTLEEAAEPWTVVDPTSGAIRRNLPPVPLDDHTDSDGIYAWANTTDHGDIFSATEAAEAAEALSTVDAVLSAASAFINHPSYELEAFPLRQPYVQKDHTLGPEIDSLFLSKLAASTALRGVYRNEVNGDVLQAWGDGRLILRMSKNHPVQTNLMKMGTHTPVYHSVSLLHYLISDIQDKAFFKSELEELKQFKSECVHLHDSEVFIETIARLRWRARHGELVELSRKRTGAEYFQESIFGTNPPKPQSLEEIFYYFLSFVLPVDRLGLLFFYDIGSGREWNDDSHLQTSVQYDLLLLAIANHILELEGSPKATASSAFIPRFFESDLMDPFSEKPYLWDATRETFYSVGPNRVDDGNAPLMAGNTVGDIGLSQREKTAAEKAEEEKVRSAFMRGMAGGGYAAYMADPEASGDIENATQPLTDDEVLQAIDRVKGATEGAP